MKKASGHMAQGKPQLKFESNPCSNFRDNRCHGRTTYDGRRTSFDFMSQAELKRSSRVSRPLGLAFDSP